MNAIGRDDAVNEPQDSSVDAPTRTSVTDPDASTESPEYNVVDRLLTSHASYIAVLTAQLDLAAGLAELRLRQGHEHFVSDVSSRLDTAGGLTALYERERVLERERRSTERLTAQELQVATVVANGATNAEAATQLFLSTKTIEYHLSNVYRKIGVHSRVELARRMLGGPDQAAPLPVPDLRPSPRFGEAITAHEQAGAIYRETGDRGRPITLVVTAVALGAAAGLTDTATTAVNDAYAGLKALLTRREVDVSALERIPDSPTQRAALAETLTSASDVVDDEVIEAAQWVTEAVATQDPAAGEAIGVDLERVRAEFLRIASVDSTGTGVKVRDGQFSGGIDIGQVRAGARGDRPSSR